MNKILKISFVIMFGAFGALALSVDGKNEFYKIEASENTAAPKTLYVRNCARCHGADGKGQNELGRTLDVPDLTADKTSVKRNVQVITNGAGAMPAFGKKLKKSDINALANYVRSL